MQRTLVFHVRERGVFGAVFRILISLGIYFAFDWGYMIVNNIGVAEVFFIPAVLLFVFWIIDLFIVRNTPEAELGSLTLTPQTPPPETMVHN